MPSKNIPPLPFPIDYSKIIDALNYYQEEGFKYIEVPWIVSEEADQITGKGLPIWKGLLGVHVASAEQSFLQLILDKNLKPGKYVSCTPCFRNDKLDEIHHKWFLKVELIDFIGYSKLTKSKQSPAIKNMINTAKGFFDRYTEVRIEEVEDHLDLSLLNTEIGSYGYRETKEFSWVYGTGIAEPRFSQILSKIPTGYHLSKIPRGVLGEFSKIEEEFEELKDSIKQKNKVLSICELADLLGSIELFAQNYSLTLGDIIKMKDLTEKAFLCGERGE
jgi:hypothetical protein